MVTEKILEKHCNSIKYKTKMMYASISSFFFGALALRTSIEFKTKTKIKPYACVPMIKITISGFKYPVATFKIKPNKKKNKLINYVLKIRF